MSKKFKEWFGCEVAEELAPKFAKVVKDFDEKGFISYIGERAEGEEMSGRLDIVIDAIEKYVSEDYLTVLGILEQILGPKLEKEEGMFTEGWWLWPVGRYVERHALESLEKSYTFIYELTQRFTGEFAIRPLLKDHPKQTLDILKEWSRDESVHVRRLASEGMRSRLPWGEKVYVYGEYGKECREVWNNLKSDKSKFVQKSVANGINDLIKEDRDKGMELLKDWLADEPTKETKWIVKHALRWLVKQEDAEAIALRENL
jgi:3-methyladenine DNA glycosylase AlkC